MNTLYNIILHMFVFVFEFEFKERLGDVIVNEYGWVIDYGIFRIKLPAR